CRKKIGVPRLRHIPRHCQLIIFDRPCSAAPTRQQRSRYPCPRYHSTSHHCCSPGLCSRGLTARINEYGRALMVAENSRKFSLICRRLSSSSSIFSELTFK